MAKIIKIAVCFLFITSLLVPAFAQEVKQVQLPAPKMDETKPLGQVLKDRKTSRDFGQGNLSPQTLSNLLWAAFGINRPDTGRRTAPSARNRQEIDIYVTTADGAYVYDPKANALVPVASGDIRALTGTQPFCKDAAVNLVYVADLAKMSEGEESAKLVIAAANTGFIGENVYLYCASEGLSVVFRALIDRQKLSQALKLRPDQRITFAQSAGLPGTGK